MPSCHVPSTLAGTIHSSAVHQLTQSPEIVSVWSACQSSIVNVLDTMRVPGFMLRILSAQLHVDRRQQEQRDDVGLREVGLEDVGLDERGACRSTPASAALLLRDSATMSGLYSMPIARGAALGRGDDRAAVARAQVVVDVLRRDLGHVEHLLDQRLRRRHPDDVLARLADRRLERLGGRGTASAARRAGERNRRGGEDATKEAG